LKNKGLFEWTILPVSQGKREVNPEVPHFYAETTHLSCKNYASRSVELRMSRAETT
jgi:hypothetical protein